MFEFKERRPECRGSGMLQTPPRCQMSNKGDIGNCATCMYDTKSYMNKKAFITWCEKHGFNPDKDPYFPKTKLERLEELEQV